MRSEVLRRLSLLLVAVTGCAALLNAEAFSAKDTSSVPAAELKFVVMVSRHGVRSPTGKTDQLNQFSAQPWPAWTVPPGYLTEHGAKLMTMFGSYDRELFAQQGLLAPSGCADEGHIRIVADSDQRTRETGKALALGLMPGCSVPVQALAEGAADPLFHSLEAGFGHPDKPLAVAAVLGRIGSNPAGLAEAYRPQLQAMEDILSGAPENAANAHPERSLFDIPASVTEGKSDHLVEFRGPLATASTMAENLLLEYSEGLPHPGWGRVDLARLRELMDLHTASADLERRTRYLARIQASNLLSHILDSMRQAAEQRPIAGAIGKPADKLLILVGHDTNLANIAGTLDLNWLIDGRRDDTPPGGALVFELWQKPGAAAFTVRTYYTAQTLDQMRNATPLSLANPPERVPVFVPGCSGPEDACSWPAFEAAVRSSIDIEPVK